MGERFLYSVFPKMLIKNLPGVPAFKNSKSLSLTKDEVKICLRSGSVYRRFANESKTEKVNLSNIDRLHHDRFMTEEEYEEFKKRSVDSNRGQINFSSTVVTPPVAAEEVKEAEVVSTETVAAPAMEESKVESETTDTNVEVTTDTLNETESIAEESVSTPVAVEEVKEAEVVSTEETNTKVATETTTLATNSPVVNNTTDSKKTTAKYNNNQGKNKNKH